jgi:hypothetical protein
MRGVVVPVKQFASNTSLIIRDDSCAYIAEEEDVAERWAVAARFFDDEDCRARVVALSYAAGMTGKQFAAYLRCRPVFARLRRELAER